MSKRSSAETVKIHLVIGHIDHSGSDVLRAFADPNDAVRFQKQLQDLDQKRPSYGGDDSEDSYDLWEKKYKRWCAAHPLRERLGGGRGRWFVTQYDNIYVQPVDLHV